VTGYGEIVRRGKKETIERERERERAIKVQAEREKIESRGKPVGKMKSEERLKGDGRKEDEEKDRKRGYVTLARCQPITNVKLW